METYKRKATPARVTKEWNGLRPEVASCWVPFSESAGALPTYILGAHRGIGACPSRSGTGERESGLGAILSSFFKCKGAYMRPFFGGPPPRKERRPIKPTRRDETKRRHVQVGKATTPEKQSTATRRLVQAPGVLGYSIFCCGCLPPDPAPREISPSAPLSWPHDGIDNKKTVSVWFNRIKDIIRARSLVKPEKEKRTMSNRPFVPGTS